MQHEVYRVSVGDQEHRLCCYSHSNFELVRMSGNSQEHKMCNGVLSKHFNFLLHAHSRTETARALSSREVEWHGCCAGAAELLYAQQLLKEVGITVETPQLYIDATVAKSVHGCPLRTKTLSCIRDGT
eukprot:2038472-Amphidinium_carterae.2